MRRVSKSKIMDQVGRSSMSDEVTFLIHKDLKAFTDIVFTDDQNVRLKKLNSSLARIRRTRDFSPAALMGGLQDDES